MPGQTAREREIQAKSRIRGTGSADKTDKRLDSNLQRIDAKACCTAPAMFEQNEDRQLATVLAQHSVPKSRTKSDFCCSPFSDRTHDSSSNRDGRSGRPTEPEQRHRDLTHELQQQDGQRKGKPDLPWSISARMRARENKQKRALG
jgi:hypothetical protein